jgi:hypothetical protein
VPDDVTDVRAHATIELDQEIDGAKIRFSSGSGEVAHSDPDRRSAQVRLEVDRKTGFVVERVVLGALFDEEIEWIDDAKLGDEIDFDLQGARLFGKDESKEIIAVRILLPVLEMFAWTNRRRIRRDGRTTMRRGPQAHHLRSETYGAVVPIRCSVVKSDANCHVRARGGGGRNLPAKHTLAIISGVCRSKTRSGDKKLTRSSSFERDRVLLHCVLCRCRGGSQQQTEQ